MNFLTDSASRLIELRGQMCLEAGIDLENGRQNQVFWLGE